MNMASAPEILPAVRLAPELDATEQAFPEPGEYWKSLRPVTFEKLRSHHQDEETIPAGTPFLIVDVAVIQGDFHSAKVFVPAPYGLTASDYRTERLSYTAEEFFETFEPCQRDASEIVRAKQDELNRAMDAFRELQDGIGASIERLAAPAAAARTVSGDQGGDLPAKAETLPDIERVENEIEAKTETAHALIAITASEISAQMAAAMHRPKRMLDALTQVLGRIAAYSGEDVEVERITNGPRTTEPQPLTVFQSMRFMDEELILHIAEGGADYRDWREFVKRMGEDEKLLNRILPAEHSLCLMRYRRKEKVYDRSDSAEAALTNYMHNKSNRVAFLLYRDGRSLWRIDSPVTAYRVPSLFPTAEQLDAPFHSRWPSKKGERIRFGDLEYRKSWNEHEQTVYAYKTLLLVLWGLQDRKRLFPWLPNRPMDQLIRDPEAFRWVHDDENLIGNAAANIFDWLGKRQSEYLQSGVRVLCNWRALISKKTAPAFGRDGWGMHRARDKSGDIGNSGCSVAIARRQGNEFYVECPVNYGETRTVQVLFSRWIRDSEEASGGHGTGAIVVDAVRLADVDRYIESREARKHYVHFIDTLMALRELLKRDRDEQRAMREAIAARHPDADIEDAFFEAVRTWRAVRRGSPLPQLGDPDFEKALKQIDEAVTAELSDEAEALREELAGENPVAIARTGHGRIVSYAREPEGERPLTPQLFHRRKQWIRRANGSLRFERESLERYSRPLPASEAAIWEADTAERPEKESQVWLYSITPRQFAKIEQLCAATGYFELIDGKVTEEERKELLARMAKGSLPMDTFAVQILGSAFMCRDTRYVHHSEGLYLFSVEEPLAPLLWRSLDSAGREGFRRGGYSHRELVWRIEDWNRHAYVYMFEPGPGQLENLRFQHHLHADVLPLGLGQAHSREFTARKRGHSSDNGNSAWNVRSSRTAGAGFRQLAEAQTAKIYSDPDKNRLPADYLQTFGWDRFVALFREGGEPWSCLNKDT